MEMMQQTVQRTTWLSNTFLVLLVVWTACNMLGMDLVSWKIRWDAMMSGSKESDEAKLQSSLATKQRSLLLSYQPPSPDSVESHRRATVDITDKLGPNLQYLDASELNLEGMQAIGTVFSLSRWVRSSLVGARFSFGVGIESDFSESDATESIFQGARLDRARFRFAILRHADFSGASLRGVDFSFADLTGVNFRQADLTGAIFDGATLDNVRLDGAVVVGLSFYKTQAEGLESPGVNLSDADFSYANLGNAELRAIQADRSFWVGTHADNTAFDQIEARTATWVNAEMGSTTWRHAQLESPVLVHAALWQTDWRHAKLLSPRWIHATSHKSLWTDSQITRSRWYDCESSQDQWHQTVLKDSDWVGGKILSGTAHRSHWSRVDFSFVSQLEWAMHESKMDNISYRFVPSAKVGLLRSVWRGGQWWHSRIVTNDWETASFQGVSFRETALTSTTAPTASCSGCLWLDMPGNVLFSGSVIQSVAALEHAAASSQSLSWIDLSGLYLSDVRLPYADLSHASFRDSWLVGADLRGADLRGARMDGATLTHGSIKGAKMEGMVVERGYFEGLEGLEEFKDPRPSTLLVSR